MKARKLSANALLGMLGIAACSGGGGVASGDLPDPNQTGSSDTPPSGYDIPPSGIDNPPGQDVPPPSGDSPGAAAGDVPGGTCQKVCNAFFSHQCACPGDDVNACVAGCNTAFPKFGACVTEINALVECAISSPSFVGCNIFRGDVEAGDYRECTIHAVNLAHCFDLNTFDFDEFADDSASGLGDCGSGGGGAPNEPQGGNAGKGGPPPRGGTDGNPTGGATATGGAMATGGTGGMATGGMATGGTATGGVGGV